MTASTLSNTIPDSYIVRAQPHDAEILTQLIFRSLARTAPCQWLFPVNEVRSQRLPALIHAHLEHALTHGLVYTTEDRVAAALWYVHRGGPVLADSARAAMTEEAVGATHAERFEVFEHASAAARPTEPHHYLRIAAVDPLKRRQRIATRLMTACHRELAHAGRPAYLEAPDPDTRTVVRRWDYRDLAGPEIVLPGSQATKLSRMFRPWIPVEGQRVMVRDEVKRWGGAAGRVTFLNPVTLGLPAHSASDGDEARPVRVAIDGDEVRDFALAELRPERPRDPVPR